MKREHGPWRRQFIDRFEALTGVNGASPSPRRLPRAFLSRAAPSPLAIVNNLEIGTRTLNTLRRHGMAIGAEGRWTYDRLLQIPGFGMATLLDVLEALAIARRGTVRVATRSLRDELSAMHNLGPGSRKQPLPPHLRRTIAALLARLPALESDVVRFLAAADLLPRGTTTIAEIEGAVRRCMDPVPFAVFRGHGAAPLVIEEGRRALAALVYSLASRMTSHRGLVRVHNVAFAARTEDLTFVRAVVSTRRTFGWLDQRDGWFWCQGSRSRLSRTIQEVLSTERKVRLSDLAALLFQGWPAPLIPPRRVLAALCRHLPACEVAGRTIRAVPSLNPERIDTPSLPSGKAAEIVDEYAALVHGAFHH